MKNRFVMLCGLAVMLTGSLVSWCPAQANAGERPMNILVLYADDWRHDTLGVAGNPVVQTPNLDRLAGNGMRFTQNCVTTSICMVKGVKTAWRSEFFYEHHVPSPRIPVSEALVRKAWKYFFWPQENVEQLFDLRSDPHEENDLAANPEYAKRLDEMRQRFAQLKAEAR